MKYRNHKKDVALYAKKFGCEALYSGKDRTMYIHGIQEHAAVSAINSQLKPMFNVQSGNHIIRKSSV
jgi:hypothetical protein